MADFPIVTMSAKPDTAKYSVSTKDPAHRVELQGGFVMARARYKRRPRRTFSIGFTNISEADKQALMTFWDLKRGGAGEFSYLDWATGDTIQVRFVGAPTFAYKGIGIYKRWDVDGIVLEEV